MSFKADVQSEIYSVFLNLDEFADLHQIDGKEIPCVVDEQSGMAQTAKQGDFMNISGIGLVESERIVFCRASDLDPLPLPGQKLVMDDKEWFVADSGVSETMGMLCLPLNRAF